MLRLKGDRWIAWEFKPQDFWIGIFWKREETDYYTLRGHVKEELDIWVCLFPCFPIHYKVATKYGAKQPRISTEQDGWRRK